VTFLKQVLLKIGKYHHARLTNAMVADKLHSVDSASFFSHFALPRKVPICDFCDQSLRKLEYFMSNKPHRPNRQSCYPLFPEPQHWYLCGANRTTSDNVGKHGERMTLIWDSCLLANLKKLILVFM
jgi:hypothetical protein